MLKYFCAILVILHSVECNTTNSSDDSRKYIVRYNPYRDGEADAATPETNPDEAPDPSNDNQDIASDPKDQPPPETPPETPPEVVSDEPDESTTPESIDNAPTEAQTAAATTAPAAEHTVEIIMFTTTTKPTTTEATLPPISTYSWFVWCKMQWVHYDCDGKLNLQQRFSFDVKMGSCVKSMIDSSCEHNMNVFKDKRSCNDKCRDYAFKELKIQNPEVRCRLQPEFGDCAQYHPMFYYDVNERTCQGFSYSGCGGNTNRFDSVHSCTIVCGFVH